MKIRTGFVSNSSSSSFCILGYYMDDDAFVGKIKDVEDAIYKLQNGLNEPLKFEDGINNEEKLALLFEEYSECGEMYEAMEHLGIDGVHDAEGEYIVVGRDWPSIRDDETGKEFKYRVKQEVGFVLDIEDAEPETHEGEIYN